MLNIDMSVVNVTESAKKHMEGILEKQNKQYVKLSVKGGGCAGFQYEWNAVDNIDADDELIELKNGKFAIDGVGLMYVIGTTIDYKQEVFGSYMSIVNPNATSSCGCGESFGV
jgi:iron-sulfur cluster assembly accessory protein